MNVLLPQELSFIQEGEIWAIVSESDTASGGILEQVQGKQVERVSYKHRFRNLSHTTEFYYQQRFNAGDAEDAMTVQQYLASQMEETVDKAGSDPGDGEQVNTPGMHPSAPIIGQPYWSYQRLVDTFSLAPLLNEQVIKLSNGETKRALIAAALMNNPRVLLLDHPLTGLDTQVREVFSHILRQITDSGILVILATSPFEIPSSVTHVAVVKENRIIHTTAKGSFDPEGFHFTPAATIDMDALKELLAFSNPDRFGIMVAMKNVTVKYDGKIILDYINWMIRQGERWQLSGPNGAGKSTLLSLINGDNPQAYANDIVLFDRKRGTGESIWDIKKQTGYISPELFQYFPTDSSCLHTVESGFYDTIGLFRPSNPDKERICLQWMRLMHIGDYATKLFSRVPSNVQRLCLLARALVKNPSLLILDEPSQGLDVPQQQFFTRLVDAICVNSDVTLIYVSHYQHHVPACVDRFLRLDQGKTVG